MKLNHLNLVVADVAAAIRLFEDHLGFRCLENRKGMIAVLSNEDNFVLIFWSTELNQSPAVSYPENFHIGFYQQDKEAVYEIYEKLKRENVVFDSGPQKMRNTFGFYFHFDQMMIEISVQPAERLK